MNLSFFCEATLMTILEIIFACLNNNNIIIYNTLLKANYLIDELRSFWVQ